MPRFHRLLSCALVLGAPLTLHACLESHVEPSIDVEASISSVTLAEDCGGSDDSREAEPAPGRWAGDCAEGESCGGWCQQTGVQLAIDAGPGDTTVPFEVLSVELHSMDGAMLEALSPRQARVFVEDGYTSWDEQVAPGASLRVTYDTSSPDWTAIGGGDSWATYGMSFRVVMRVRIDGVERTLEFEPASREAEIVT